MQKSVAFLYTNKELSENEAKKMIPLTIASKTIKYLGKNTAKQAKDLYTQNYKTLMNKIKDDINKRKETPRS